MEKKKGWGRSYMARVCERLIHQEERGGRRGCKGMEGHGVKDVRGTEGGNHPKQAKLPEVEGGKDGNSAGQEVDS